MRDVIYAGPPCTLIERLKIQTELCCDYIHVIYVIHLLSVMFAMLNCWGMLVNARASKRCKQKHTQRLSRQNLLTDVDIWRQPSSLLGPYIIIVIVVIYLAYISPSVTNVRLLQSKVKQKPQFWRKVVRFFQLVKLKIKVLKFKIIFKGFGVQ